MVSSNDIIKAERARRHAQSRQNKQRNRRERNKEQLKILNRALYREAENRRQATLRREFKSRQQEDMSWNGFDHEVGAAPDVPPNTLLGEIAGLFNNATYADLTIYLGTSELKLPAHRLILGLRSPYFRDALSGNMKEAATGEFRFPDDSEPALWRVFQFMYSGDYDSDSGGSVATGGDDPELLKHPRVYALAEYFRIEELKSLSLKKFEVQLQKLWVSETFSDCVREVYASSHEQDRRMRDAVVGAARTHLKNMRGSKSFQNLLRGLGDFAVDLLQVVNC